MCVCCCTIFVIMLYYGAKWFKTDGFENKNKIYKSEDGWFMSIKGTAPQLDIIMTTDWYKFSSLNTAYENNNIGRASDEMLKSWELPDFDTHFWTSGYINYGEGYFSSIIPGKLYGQRILQIQIINTGILVDFKENGRSIHTKKFSLYTDG
jgi:hypothetical protein